MAKRQKKTKDTDRGAKRILRELKSIKTASIEAGYFEGVPSSDPGITLAELATIHEFGVFEEGSLRSGAQIGKIPPRPFMRPAYDKNILRYKAAAKKLLQRVTAKEISGLQALKAIGALMASDIKKEITDLKEPENAPATEKRKGFNNPLIETSTMKNRADFRIKV